MLTWCLELLLESPFGDVAVGVCDVIKALVGGVDNEIIPGINEVVLKV